MLHTEIVRDDAYRLAVAFTHPVLEEISSHPEFRKFWNLVCTLKGFRTKEQDGLLVGFDLPLDEWAALVRSVFPEHAEFQQVFLDKILSMPELTVNECIEVNHHQHSFDSAQRSWLFVLNQGHFFEYVLNRIYWRLGPELGVIASFPLHVDIETANTCNMNCPMCYRNMLKSVGQMDFGLFKSLIDECEREHVFSVRLSWRGEPLTHPRIKEMISYATARIPNVSFLTNAFYLEDDILDCVVDSRLSYVAVSFDGVEDVYEKIRHPALFADSRKRLQKLIDKRASAGSVLPQVRLCTIWPAIRHDPDRYQALMQPVSDYMVYNPYINFRGEMTLKDGFVCQYPWQRIMVAWNGDVQCCTGWNATDIVLGNAADRSIKDFWSSPELERIRMLHAQGRRMELVSCAECRHGCVGDPNIDLDTILSREA